MNIPNTQQPSGPECARYRALLPRFRQGLISATDDTILRAHLATCAYCQAQLATYDRLDAALSTYIDRFAPTTPAADDLVRGAVARVASASSAMNGDDHPYTPRMRQKDSTMFDSSDTTQRTPTVPPDSRPSRNTRPVLATIAALLLIGLAAALFTMFTRSAPGPAHSSTPTTTALATATPTETDVATATAIPTQSTTLGIVTSGHPCSSDTSGRTRYIQIGDLKVSQVSFGLAYPANALPANLDPSKPYQLPDNLPNPPNPPVNPLTSNGGGYGLTVCNASGSTSHVIRGITVRIAAFTAYNGTLNTYMFCDSFYQRPNGLGGGGCGGGSTFDEQLQASFAADATTGARVTTTQVNAGNAPPLPVQLGPGQMLVINMGVMPPTAAGTYTFAFGLNYDSVVSAPVSTMTPTIFDSAAIKWTGSNCTAPALLSQIPTGATGKYVCAP